MQALGRLAAGEMNKTEKAYEQKLQADPDVIVCQFEAIKLRLGHNSHYTPDFFVQRKDGHIEFHEVKGHWEEDARTKIKVAADRYPMFRFVAVKKLRKAKGGGWSYEYFKAH